MQINEYWRRAEHRHQQQQHQTSDQKSPGGARGNGDAATKRAFLPKKSAQRTARGAAQTSAIGSMLSAATRSGFIAATATGSSERQAAAFRLINGQLVQCENVGTTTRTTVEAPADDPEQGRDGELVEPDAVIINLELQEWKRLARIMDRLFFWLTLTALISVSVVLTVLLMSQK